MRNATDEEALHRLGADSVPQRHRVARVDVRTSEEDMKCWHLVYCLIGTHCALGQATRFVAQGNPLAAIPYQSWSNAASTIQDAIDAAHAGDLILVSNGIYATGGRAVTNGPLNRVTLDKSLTVRSVNGPTVTTILGHGPVGDSAIRCAYVGPGASIEGFTLTGGATCSTGHFSYARSGGGAYCVDSTALLRNCVVVSNTAMYGGGGHVNGTLSDCHLLCNRALEGDGGASYYGKLIRCKVSGNQAAGGLGGGTYRVEAHSSLIVGNTNDSFGGGAFGSSLYNCVVIGNASTGSVATAGGVSGGGHVNCIVLNNYATLGDHNYNSTLQFGVVASLENCCTFPMPSIGSGNITNAPRFVDAGNGDYRLRGISPCVDAGTDLGWTATETDLDGNGRVFGNAVDIGAYETLITCTEILNETGKVFTVWTVPNEAVLFLESCDNLSTGVWDDVGGVVTSVTSTVLFEDATSLATSRFYRLRWVTRHD